FVAVTVPPLVAAGPAPEALNAVLDPELRVSAPVKLIVEPVLLVRSTPLPAVVLIVPAYVIVALLLPTWNAVAAELVVLMLLPLVSEKVPVPLLNAAPVVPLPLLVIDCQRKLFIATVERSMAGPPTADTVATGEMTPGKPMRNPAEPV